MPALKPAYLVHGDDHGAVAERRAGLRALGERDSGAAGVELLEGDAAAPQAVALALAAMTLAVGHRVIVVDGAERFKEADVEQHLLPAMAEMPPQTTVAFFAREEGRTKAPPALHDAVLKAGGQIVTQETVKPWELPGWVREQAGRMGLSVDAAAAKALVATVGERQQRLVRELEKLSLELDAPPVGGAMSVVTAEQIERRAARSSQSRAYSLADALVAGDERVATGTYVRLRAQGERLGGLMFLMAARLREARAVSARLQAGEPPAAVRRSLRMPPKAAERFISDVARTDPERLRGAIEVLADLERDSHGGAVTGRRRPPSAALDEDTLALRAIEAIAG